MNLKLQEVQHAGYCLSFCTQHPTTQPVTWQYWRLTIALPSRARLAAESVLGACNEQQTDTLKVSESDFQAAGSSYSVSNMLI